MSNQPLQDDPAALRAAVRDRYARAAQTAASNAPASCCEGPVDPVTVRLYTPDELTEIPETARLASLGCGNPTALAELRPGEIVLDLGSGGGIDVLLSAKRVGPTGFAYGLDMTDEMLALAERNRAEAGVENVRFLRGEIEQIPLPENAVNVIISNCVINLSADKDRVLAEAFRVLKPGGRFTVSDIVVQGTLPKIVRTSIESWVGCLAGALTEAEYRAKLAAAGFTDVEIQVTRVHSLDSFGEATDRLKERLPAGVSLDEVDGRVVSAFVRARKPE
ncbi:MAG TPA: arsenite methyltransferase [Dehalococcoidia bacterium]|nr:arsenite methyltransferase [Dehalococcoidia bacterium]